MHNASKYEQLNIYRCPWGRTGGGRETRRDCKDKKKKLEICAMSAFFAGRSLQFRDLPDISLHITHLPYTIVFLFFSIFLEFLE